MEERVSLLLQLLFLALEIKVNRKINQILTKHDSNAKVLAPLSLANTSRKRLPGKETWNSLGCCWEEAVLQSWCMRSCLLLSQWKMPSLLVPGQMHPSKGALSALENKEFYLVLYIRNRDFLIWGL